MVIRNWLGVFGLVALATACTSSNSGAGSAAATVQAATSGGDMSSSITFHNNSNWAIMEIHMSPVNQTTWGPDHLGANILRSGASFTLHGVPCDSYDLKLIDEDRDECVLHNVNICAESSGWNIDNEDLLSCQAFTRRNGS